MLQAANVTILILRHNFHNAHTQCKTVYPPSHGDSMYAVCVFLHINQEGKRVCIVLQVANSGKANTMPSAMPERRRASTRCLEPTVRMFRWKLLGVPGYLDHHNGEGQRFSPWLVPFASEQMDIIWFSNVVYSFWSKQDGIFLDQSKLELWNIISTLKVRQTSRFILQDDCI